MSEDDSAFGIKVDNKRVLMSEQLKGVIDDETLVTPDIAQNFISIVMHFAAPDSIIVGSLVGIRRSKGTMVLSAKVSYDDALQLTMKTPGRLTFFELHQNLEAKTFGEASYDVQLCEMFDLNPTVGMCTIVLELVRI